MFDIAHIREELNELPFRDGKREVFVGRVSEGFEAESEETITDHLDQFEQELRNHTLILTRHKDDRDALFVVQELRTLAPDYSWMAGGMNWVSKITAVVLVMVLPGLAGLWLDNQLDTRFLTLLGFSCGVPLGIWHLIAMTKNEGSSRSGHRMNNDRLHDQHQFCKLERRRLTKSHALSVRIEEGR